MGRLHFIDALRGFAVLGVILVHTGQACGFIEGVAFGARGVQLFFVISAFTLLLTWSARDDGAGAFFVRRVFRIAPMFWVSIPIHLLIIGSEGLGLVQILAAAMFLQASSPQWILSPIVAGGWSIDVELAFYCLFPLLARWIRSLPVAIFFLAIAFAVSDLWLHRGLRLAESFYPQLPPSDVATFVGLSLPHQLPAFAAGFVAFFAVPKMKGAPRLALESTLICAIFAIAYFAAYDMHNVFAFSMCFGTVLAAMGAGAGRYLINPLIVLIGRCSFSIYLLHFAVTDLLRAPANTVEAPSLRFAVLFSLVTAATTVLAFLTFSFVEKPMIAVGNRLTSRMARKPVPAAALTAQASQMS
jgi:peptidoglycan/LPS O-acetylase OafA/YrhL